ncbi:MAG: hypothetical protein U9Q70_01380 [Chloroflexota bacterium]|nr:hypothetical protein [Chloroflexota bacterium]
MAIYLVCEGEPDSLDVRVLDLIVAQKMGLPVQIETVGGGSSGGSVATWLEKRGHRAYTIQDRDYRSHEQVEKHWRVDSKRLMWRRHEIENYLLDPRIVLTAFRQLQQAGIQGANNLPDDLASTERLLQDLARPLLEDHTGRCTYWSLHAQQSVADMRFELPQPPGLYPTREMWLDYLEREGCRFQDVCGRLASDEVYCRAAIEYHYDEAWERISAPHFLSSGRFIEEMGGHELLSALGKDINERGVSHLSIPDLGDELLKALDELYCDAFFAPNDFAQLAERLK